MKSIRQRLTVSLLGGFILLWGAGGVAVYGMFRSSELARLDAELEDAAHGVRLAAGAEGDDELAGPGRGSKRRRAKAPEFDQPGSGYYFEIRGVDGKLEESSPSLEGRPLVSEKALSENPATGWLENGEEVRMVALKFGFGGPPSARRGRGLRKSEVRTAVVALSMEGVNRSLSALITGLFLAGGVGAGAGALLIGLALKNGMRPLNRLATEAGSLMPESLSRRFGSDGLPLELAPVVEKLNDLLGRLDESFHRERQFSADLAHELRTPLAETRNAIELGLRFPEELSEKQRQGILQSCDRMERIVSSMLRLVKCENGENLQQEAIDLKSMIEDRWQIFQGRALRRGITLELELDSDGVIVGDRDLWALLVDNLLSNAASHAPEGSLVKVGSTEEVLLEVSNLAPDLGGEDLEKMFARLWRGDLSRTSEEHCGLGLSISRACARSLGCRLDAVLGDDGRLRMRVTEVKKS